MFTSDKMAECLDQEEVHQVKYKAHSNQTKCFQFDGKGLRHFLTRTENFRKVFVIQSEGSEKIDFLGDIPEERTFDGSDFDEEEFIGKVISWM